MASFQQQAAAAAAALQLPVSGVGLGLQLPSLTTLQALARKSDTITTLTSSGITQPVPLTLTPSSANTTTQSSSHES